MLDELIAGNIKIEKGVRNPSTIVALEDLLLKMEDGDSFLLSNLSIKEKASISSSLYSLRCNKKLGSLTKVISADNGLTSLRVWRVK